MSLVTLVFLLATVSITLTNSQETGIPDKSLDVTQAPIKLDKNLRRALLKALTDLEAESAEQRKEESESIAQRDTSAFEVVAKQNLNDDLGAQKTKFSFKSFPSDDDIPSEDKLQNSSFIDAVHYVTLKSPIMNIEKATQEDARSFHVQNVILPVKNPANFGIKTEPKVQQKEKTTQATFSVHKVESLTLKPATEISESLAGSASNGIATANALVAPKPTEITPTVSTRKNVTVIESNDSKDKTEEVKIFQAPLVAAFTVQQDEQGVPKSVVPIFRSPNDGQALTLQEQLEFKQQLLEKQLAELQQQQIQQTQFLVRQQQLYEQQLRQKQQHQFYLQEQARIKQLEEQARIKQLEEQTRIKQLEEQTKLKRLEEQARFKQLEEQRFKFEEQRLNRFQPQRPIPQKQSFFEQSNNILSFQPPVESNVHLQPSLALEVPNVDASPAFQSTFQPDQRLQPFRQQPQAHHQLQQQQLPQLPQPQQLQQLQQLPQPQQLQPPQQHQRLQQSFGSFSNDFQPSLTPASRFNRQEAFNSIGNFGFNVDNKANTANVRFNPPHRTPGNFFSFTQFKSQAHPPTPARQIQQLLYQSGIAGDPNNAQGIGSPEDLNIVSKVLALNVGAVPNKN
ncbi:signal transducer and activator of transcription C-like [Bombus terrestris]|uniref:Signal transducer and activator of transcription C-like n=1 Tax=Bombus terrestris TaxID=30195 RepID=A0A9C6WAG0_BOMTE|nr:signal transducer and activator of transcription C-like [Bombus terrestris]XP_048268500.1 signal transducer and activator of transcription C-like [Bombus terrestris]XP_048268501.1 signal transducer and activator of transcription C-like [Bombus terrestris]XP_048268502.1 signal transducer and activator of transcription C-like [Bombus terrestris]